jgi:hypothetical protein
METRTIKDSLGPIIGRKLGGVWRWTQFGPDGIKGVDGQGRSVIVSAADHDGVEFIHASVARPERLPSYHDLVALHQAVWGPNGFAYQVFASQDRHVSIHSTALHLWGRSDGANVLPDFGEMGTI